jgi:hypothetical protein
VGTPCTGCRYKVSRSPQFEPSYGHAPHIPTHLQRIQTTPHVRIRDFHQCRQTPRVRRQRLLFADIPQSLHHDRRLGFLEPNNASQRSEWPKGRGIAVKTIQQRQGLSQGRTATDPRAARSHSQVIADTYDRPAQKFRGLLAVLLRRRILNELEQTPHKALPSHASPKFQLFQLFTPVVSARTPSPRAHLITPTADSIDLVNDNTSRLAVRRQTGTGVDGVLDPSSDCTS